MKQWMQKKKRLLALALVLLAGFAYWNWPGPAPDLPEAKEVDQIALQSIRVTEETTEEVDSQVLTEQKEISDFLADLATGRKTRISSANDNPQTPAYVRIEVTFQDGHTSRAYLYEDYDGTYFEQPYTGIYKLKNPPQSLVELLAD